MEEKIDVQKIYQQSMNFNTIMNKIEDVPTILSNLSNQIYGDDFDDLVTDYISERIKFVLICYGFEIINYEQYIKLEDKITEIKEITEIIIKEKMNNERH